MTHKLSDQKAVPLYRILFDSSAGNSELGYLLWFDKSRQELNCIGSELRECLRVLIYMPDELELEAELKFDIDLGCWRGIPDKM